MTVILEVNADKSYLLLDAPSDARQRQQIDKGGGLSVQSSLDGARIEFRSEKGELIELDGAPALRLKLPQRILKVQRRDYFRASIRPKTPTVCAVPLRKDLTLDCRVMDIGLGGIALSSPEDAPELIVGKIHDKCLVNLHEAGSLEVSIRVRHAALFRRDGKISMRRYGCEFVALRNPQKTVIQRYVLQLERDRGASAATT